MRRGGFVKPVFHDFPRLSTRIVDVFFLVMTIVAANIKTKSNIPPKVRVSVDKVCPIWGHPLATINLNQNVKTDNP